MQSLARVSILPRDGEAFVTAFSALEAQPARLIIAGAPRLVGATERRRLFDSVSGSLPASWTPARTLQRLREGMPVVFRRDLYTHH